MGTKRLSGLLAIATACAALANDPDKGKDPTGTSGALDGWPLHSWLNPEPLPEVNYAVIRLREIGLPADVAPEQIDDKGNVLAIRDPFQSGGGEGFHLDLATGQCVPVPVIQPLSDTNRVVLAGFWTNGFLSPDGVIMGRVETTLPPLPPEGNWLDWDDWPYGTKAAEWTPDQAAPSELDFQPISGGYGDQGFNVSHAICKTRSGRRLTVQSFLGSTFDDHVYLIDSQMVGWINQSNWEVPDSGGIVSDFVLNDSGVLAGLGPEGLGALWESGQLRALDFFPQALTEPDPEAGYPMVVVGKKPVAGELPSYTHGAERDVHWAYRLSSGWASSEPLKARTKDSEIYSTVKSGSGSVLANDRLEILVGDRLVRNGVIRPLADHLPTGWTLAADGPKAINRSGMILANAKAPDAQEPEPVLLLPVDIVVRKINTNAAPESGLCVNVGASITFDMNGPLEPFSIPVGYSIKWQTRQIKVDGDFTSWITRGDGCEYTMNWQLPGIFQVKAIVEGPDEKLQEFVFKRKRDVANSDNSLGVVQDIHKTGSPDYFGSASLAWQVELRDNVVEMLGDKKYAKDVSLALNKITNFGVGSDKCNAFVYHKVNDVRSAPHVPLTRGGGFGVKTNPPMAIDWWNDNSGVVDDKGRVVVSVDIPEWDLLPYFNFPEPGFVASRADLKNGEPDSYHSHCGILDYDGSWISAGPIKINKYCHILTPEYQPLHLKK